MVRVTGILTPEQETAGLSVEELDDHLIELRFKDELVVATFSAVGATPESIRQEAGNFLQGVQ